MAVVNMHDAKTQLSALLEAVESGAEAKVVIARNGKPAARLVPLMPDVFVSIASIWEIAIKHARPKGLPGDVPMSGSATLKEFERAGLDLLAIRPIHAVRAGEPPPIHRDPFDRMLVAQAVGETLLLVTGDAVLTGYGGW